MSILLYSLIQTRFLIRQNAVKCLLFHSLKKKILLRQSLAASENHFPRYGKISTDVKHRDMIKSIATHMLLIPHSQFMCENPYFAVICHISPPLWMIVGKFVCLETITAFDRKVAKPSIKLTFCEIGKINGKSQKFTCRKPMLWLRFSML